MEIVHLAIACHLDIFLGLELIRQKETMENSDEVTLICKKSYLIHIHKIFKQLEFITGYWCSNTTKQTFVQFETELDFCTRGLQIKRNLDADKQIHLEKRTVIGIMNIICIDLFTTLHRAIQAIAAITVSLLCLMRLIECE